MEKFVIIDGNSLINRAFYALPLLANFEGEYSNGVYGFVNILIKIINEQKPKYIAVAFDFGKKTFRTEMFAEYKGTRKATPTELVGQFAILKKMLTAMGITIIEKEGVEADDIIGTLTKKFKVENIILTGDKDSFQLINENTHVMFTKRGVTDVVLLTKDNIVENYGVEAHQVTDLKALMGDSSDNIPGVAGVGEKTALNLINEYKSLENIYDNIENITGKLKEKLQTSKELAFLSKQLATIKTDVDFDFKLSDFEYDFPFNTEVHKLFNQYQFNTLLKRTEIFKDTLSYENIEKAKIKVKTVQVKSIDTTKEVLTNALNANVVSMHLGENLNLYFDGVEYEFAFEINLFSDGLNIETTINELKPLFESKKVKKVVFDHKHALHSFKEFNVELKGVEFDVILARYLINNNAKSNVSIKDVLQEQGLSDKTPAFSLFELYESFSAKLKELDLENLYYNVELPLSKVLYEMEVSGFKIDVEALKELDKKYADHIEKLTKEIYEIAGMEFNINSPKQVSDLLFGKLGLKAFNNKKNSTSIDILNELENQHEIVPKLIEYRKITKLYTTYIKAFGEVYNKNTHYIHTVFNQTNTATGRLSSNEPNLQNIPIRTEEGKNFRKIFIPSSENGYILTADYSQIELRLLAAFSGDEKLISAFNNNEDIHRTTASEIFGVDPKDVTDSQRRDAKAINFGIIYGISEYGLSQNINTSVAVAANYIKKYFEKYPTVKEYMDNNIKKCKENGYVKTIFGRIRFLPEINSSNFNIRSFAERAAMNMPLQGSASDIIKLAMVKVSEKFKTEKLKSKLILQIHDELLVDCYEDELEKVTTIIKDCMENVVELPVKLSVNVDWGRNWFEAK